MKWILLAIILILVAVLIGWISFRQSEDKTTITIDRKEIKEDTKKATQKGSELIKEAKERVKKTASPGRGDKDNPQTQIDDAGRRADQKTRPRPQPR